MQRFIGQRFALWFRLLLLGLGALIAVGAPARSAHASPVGARELEARKDFAAGRYAEAVDIFAELFAKTADPVFLRNIARCHQKMNHIDEAVDDFREYLRKAKKLSPGERAEVEGYIHDLESSRASSAPTTAGPTSALAPAEAAHPAPAEAAHPALTAAPPTALAAPAAASAADQTITRPRAADHDAPGAGRSVSVAGVIVTSLGVALVGAGVVFTLATRSAATSLANQYDPALESAGRRDATLQWVGYGVGAAALTTGVVLLVRGSSTPASPAEVAALRVSVGPRGAMLQGRF